jgi:hypothetical protein
VNGDPIDRLVVRSHPHRLVVAAGDHHRAPVELRGGHRPDGVGVAGERGSDRLAGGQIPHPHRVVEAAGDRHRASVELRGRHRFHVARVAGERSLDDRLATPLE